MENENLPNSALHLIEFGTQLAISKRDYMLPVNLIGDLSDACPLSQCETLVHCLENMLFSIVEKHGTSVFNDNTAYKLQLLSISKRLVRRFSKIDNTTLCGKVLMVITYALPLSDRSGVNINGAFNMENETIFEKTKSDEKVVIDHEFYTRFWSLQQIFKNPALAYQDWTAFKSLVGEIVHQFSTQATQDAIQESKQDSQQSADSAIPDDHDVDMDSHGERSNNSDQVFIPKYLTNPKLLPLQFKDATFRRHILLQILIFLQHLEKDKKQSVCIV